MTIADISAYVLSSPVDTIGQCHCCEDDGLINRRDVVLVSVETTDGEIGWAPCGTGTVTKWKEFNEATHDDIGDVIRKIVGPNLVGESIDDMASIHDVIDSTNLPKYLRWQAKSVVDIAVYDILGQRRGQPIYEFLEYDVDPTPTLTAYPSSGFYLSQEGYAEEASQLIEQGYDMYKYRAGFGVERDRRVIDHLQTTLAKEVDIIVDAHAWWSSDGASYSRKEIRSLVEYMGDKDVFWIEEPFPSNDYKSYRELSEATGVPLAAGENEETPGNLANIAELGFLSFLQCDVKQHGGYTGSRQAVEFCEGRDVTLVPNNYGTQLGVVANAHLVAAAPECDLLEYPIYGGPDSVGMYPFPLASDIIETELETEDGQFTVPSDPGLGVSVDRDVIKNYPYERPASESVRR